MCSSLKESNRSSEYSREIQHGNCLQVQFDRVTTAIETRRDGLESEAMEQKLRKIICNLHGKMFNADDDF